MKAASVLLLADAVYLMAFGVTQGLFHTGYWWTSTSSDDDEAWFRYLDYKNADVFRYYSDKRYGFSVRCVKD